LDEESVGPGRGGVPGSRVDWLRRRQSRGTPGFDHYYVFNDHHGPRYHDDLDLVHEHDQRDGDDGDVDNNHDGRRRRSVRM
jgi:hypothetical protein